MLSVHRHTDAAAFLERAGPWLMQAEAEHNLLLGIAHQLAAGTMLFQAPFYLATIERDGDIVGCAFRTPPYKLGVTRLPPDAVDPLIDDVMKVYDAMPAVLGDDAAARLVAQRWAERAGCRAVPGMQHRIYQLDTVLPLVRPVSGRARRATLRDADRVAEWITAFSEEAGIHTPNPAGLARSRIGQSSLFLWEDEGAATAMAAWSGETPHGRRVGFVYTPPPRRGHGYATALVADLSARILADGCRFCFLYTDLSNETSNSIYQQIGYRPVCDVMDWTIECN